MAFDGFFKNTKPVNPPGPTRRYPRRPPGWKPPKPAKGPPPGYRPPGRIPRGPNRFTPVRPGTPNMPPSSGFQPRSPVPSPYGTAVPATGALMPGIPPWAQYMRWFLPKAARFNPYLNFAFMAVDLANGAVPGLPSPSPLTTPAPYLPDGYQFCGSIGGEMVRAPNNVPWTPAQCATLPIYGQPVPNQNIATYNGIYYVVETQPAPNRRVTVIGVAAEPTGVNPVSPHPARPKAQTRTGVDYPAFDDMPRVPFRIQPYAPTAPDRQLGRTATNGPKGRSSRGPLFSPYAPAPSPGSGENPFAPPSPGTKERKGKVRQDVARVIAAAWEVTEAVDLVENLHDCLPDKVKSKTPKTGVTTQSAFIGPGHRYSSAEDKARHVHRNINDLDLDCAFRKISCNHIMDMLWGRFFAVSGLGARRAGVSGEGFLGTQGPPGIEPSQWEKHFGQQFEDFLRRNPQLDNLRKSLDCENLGRS